MKVLITGVNGQLGYDVLEEAKRRGHTAIGSARTGGDCPLDLTKHSAVRRVVGEAAPDVLIHCAAWTAVDAAEEPENLPLVWDANVNATRYLAEACQETDTKMLYLSTDYVFDGSGEDPWPPDSTAFHPLNVYGRSKLEGERVLRYLLARYVIVRTSWVFGAHGTNFVKTMLNAAKTHDSVRVVRDQVGIPTYTRDLARLLLDMAEREIYGCYHASNEGEPVSWYDFTREIYRQAGCSVRVIPVTTAEYGQRKAARPFNSRLDRRKLEQAGLTLLPPWPDALSRYLAEVGKNEGADQNGKMGD